MTPDHKEWKTCGQQRTLASCLVHYDVTAKALESAQVCYQLPEQSLSSELWMCVCVWVCACKCVYFVIGSGVTCFQDKAQRSGLNVTCCKKKKQNNKVTTCFNKFTRLCVTPAFFLLWKSVCMWIHKSFYFDLNIWKQLMYFSYR